MSVFLHIGVGKTGTSSLQTFLSLFKSEIEAQSYHILRTGSDDKLAAHHQLALGFGFSVKDNDDFSIDILNALKDEVLNYKHKNIIISSENFHSHVTDKKLQNLCQAFQDTDVKVILYVRRQDEWLDSAFRQFSEIDNIYSIEEILAKAIKNRAIDYKWQVDMWGKYFGMDNVIVRVYESGQLKHDTVTDFSHVIGLNMSTNMKAYNTNTNPSISPAEAEISRIINCVSNDKKKTRDAVLKVLRDDQSIVNSQYHFMTPEIRANISAYFSEGNAQLALKYFGRTDGRLFLFNYQTPTN